MKNPEILDLYSDFLLSSFQLVTATGLSQMIDNGYSHDQISRFLSQRKFTQKDFWKMVKKVVRKAESENAILAIDDTILEKPHSTENDMICWHWDHCKGRNVKGVNILNFLYHAPLPEGEGVSLPVSFEVVEKPERYKDPKTGKEKRRATVTKNELLRERLNVLVFQNRLNFKYVAWDTWFSSKENFSHVHHKLKKCFVGAIKFNRTVALGKEDKLQGRFFKVGDLDLQTGQTCTVWIKGLDFEVQLIKQVFINKDDSTGELYLVTNDLSLSFEAISAIYEKRWNVEVFHKSLKQNAGLGKSPTKYEVTQSNHIFASMIAFCKLEVLKFKEKANHFQLKSKLYLKAVKAAFWELQMWKESFTELPTEHSRPSPLLEWA